MHIAIQEQLDGKVIHDWRSDGLNCTLTIPATQIAKVIQEKVEEPVPHWTLHDLRRTLATGMQRLGVRLEVTEAVLNHVSGSRAGIVGVYQRHSYLEEKAAALKTWAMEVARLSRAAKMRKATPAREPITRPARLGF